MGGDELRADGQAQAGTRSGLPRGGFSLPEPFEGASGSSGLIPGPSSVTVRVTVPSVLDSVIVATAPGSRRV